MPKSSNQQPPNFVDLRRRRSKHGQLIQDVLSPQNRRKWLKAIRKLNKRQSALLTLGLAMVLLIIIVAAQPATSNSPVPANIRRAVGFAIYYPAATKLPPGYALRTNSFSMPASGVVVYQVDFPAGHFAVSEEAAPSASDLANFNNQRLPVHYNLNTGLGTASVGVIGKQTVISLPTHNQTWILITGPQVTHQKDIQALVNSLQTD